MLHDRLISRSKQNCESLTYLASQFHERLLRTGKVSVTASDVRNIGKKIHFLQERGENIPKRRKFYRHRGVYKNSQFVKYADVKIPAKDPAYLQRASSEYVERSPLHFVLRFELFSSSKHITSNWLGCMYGVKRHETAPSLVSL